MLGPFLSLHNIVSVLILSRLSQDNQPIAIDVGIECDFGSSGVCSGFFMIFCIIDVVLVLM